MPIDYSHEHTSRQIMDANNVKTPINPTGGGGVEVDNGTDPPAEVTTIVAPGATIEGGTATLAASGEQTIRLLGPFSCAWDDVGIGSGELEVADLAAEAGALVIDAYMMPTEEWLVSPGTMANGGGAYVSIGPAGDAITIANYDDPNHNGYVTWAEWEPTGPASVFWKRPMVIQANSKVWVQVSPPGGSTLTSGEADIYLLIATPA